MAKAKRVKRKKVAKRRVVVRKPKGPVYTCQTCGTELVVTNTGIGFTKLICCEQEMEKKES